MKITKLYRAKKQPPAKTNKVTTTATELWVLKVDEAAIPVEVNFLLKSLDDDNEFGFLVSGQVHPSDPSLVITGFSVGRAIDDTYTIYEVTTSMTNNNATINSRVTPSRAQDSWDFSNEAVDVQVVVATANSLNTSATLST